MEERTRAKLIMQMHGDFVYDKEIKVPTCSGVTFAEAYAKVFKDYGNVTNEDCLQALRHWVESCGYNEEGEFEYIISNNILNA